MNKSLPKILLVDDTPENIQVLGGFLSGQNYNISFATSGKEALRLTQSNDYDLILLDIMMPEMSGYEFCKIIQNDAKTNEIPIIFISARTDHESILHGFEIGAVDYITKPFNHPELIARVKTHLDLREQKLMLKKINNELENIVQQRTQELRMANRELLQLDQAKTQFLQLISHELRTPINNIMLMLDVLKLKLTDVSSQNYLSRIDDSISKLMEFSDLALMITSLTAASSEINWHNIIVNELISSVLENHHTNIQEKNIDISVNNCNNKLSFMGDYLLIEKSIFVILDNAIKFSENGGKVCIECSCDNDWIYISIKDSGIGIEEEILNSIYDAFNIKNIDYHNQGFGLSLKLVHLIISAHKGQVSVMNNKEGVGACVRIAFRQLKR